MNNAVVLRRNGLAMTAWSLAAVLASAHCANAQRARIFSRQAPAVSAMALGRLAASAPVRLTFTLPLRNEAELDAYLKRIADPKDPLYGRYLSPQEFLEQYGPTQADYDAVAAYAAGQGFTVLKRHANRLVLDVAAPSATVERAFSVRLLQYRDRAGAAFHAPDAAPAVPAAVAARLSGVVGLNSQRVLTPQAQPLRNGVASIGRNNQIGTGPYNGLAPADIKAAYNLTSIAANGAGQTLGLFELDGYNASDVQAYETYFGLPFVPLQNVLIDGFSGAAGGNADEVTLDIELQAAIAPSASKIVVYEGPNSSYGLVDTFNQMAVDNQAKSISVSWGSSEQFVSGDEIGAENAIFKQMAAQGQSVYVASGDRGAQDWGQGPTVYDPASQPFVVSVGGTTLSTAGAGGAWLNENTWNNGNGNATGGGVSKVWAIPSWQSGAGSTAGMTSTTNRNVPDVALDADPYTGYAIFYNGAWNLYGGTSCAAPVWAAFNALVNQQRASAGKTPLGFAAPAIYTAARGANGGIDFHDIADGVTNELYPAVAGYDNVTGWGSLNGVNLFHDLSGAAAYTPPSTTTVTSSPLADANVHDGSYAKNNFGSQTALHVQTSAKAGSNEIAYLKFDLTALPATISSATLRLYGSNPTSGYSGAATASGVSNNSWTESGVTWNNRPAVGSALSSATVTHTAAWTQWDVTSFVQAQKAAGQTQVSLAVTMGSSAANADAFNSRESASNKPQLVVTSAAPPLAPFSVTAYPHNASITVNWIGSGDATSFSVYRATSASGPYSLLSASVVGSPYQDASAVNGVPYWYYVKAANSVGSSAASSAVTETASIDAVGDATFVQSGSLLYAYSGGGAYQAASLISVDSLGSEALRQSYMYTAGYGSFAAPIADLSGNLYVAGQNGGPLTDGGLGTVLKIDSAYNPTVLHAFENFAPDQTNTTGAFPSCALAQAADGSLYGTAIMGGAYGAGTLYRVGLDGSYVKLHDFNAPTDGGSPYAGVTLGPDGNYYGVAWNRGPSGAGTLYSITPAGVFRVVHAFTGSEGSYPRTQLVIGPDGYFYGACGAGGANGTGTVYKADLSGNITVLHNFGPMDNKYRGPDGVDPDGEIAVGSDGTIYGSTILGGPNGTGTIYKIDSAGNETLLHVFSADTYGTNTDGAYNWTGLMRAADGNLYGVNYRGGKYSYGVAYQCTPAGVFRTLHSFHF
ncbi:hypothetical protein CCAX7_17980 [Capsulimonas corticalis]|uniref:Uncharacterized protein n=1 Tax=Capsulimonas corticalis TaxID=2219043 RepID=A0A402D720_9BACT|nr:choice-of-anchor tandem repeat GloVer-containing protein [Capsulimonas corticalis]BDI29747.1 hypothetical protein CCAX7_17980 [Capsulimonas corticalis]